MALALVLAAGIRPFVEAQPPPGVWPLPTNMQCTGGSAGGSFAPALQLIATGAGATSDVVVAALARYKPILLAPATQSLAAESINVRKVTIDVAACAADCPLTAETDYSYTLQSNMGAAEVTATASSPYAVAYVLEMLSQLVDKGGKLQCTHFSITDSPEFPHRCVLLPNSLSSTLPSPPPPPPPPLSLSSALSAPIN
eukprot:SAG11_NODE_3513_length_2400_cov_25.143850_2_plen_198_part_00